MNQSDKPSRALFAYAAAAAIILIGATSVACDDDNDDVVTPLPSTWTATLSGANEVPAKAVAGTGSATIVKKGATYSYTVTFANLTAAPSASHIHAPAPTTANATVRVNFNTAAATAASGTFTGTFTAADITNPVITSDSLEVLMTNGQAYVNVHTPLNPGGEIRGQLSKTQ
jgi:hypothetical protein